MSFANIHFLYFVWAWPLLLLIVLYGRRKRRRVLRAFSDPRALAFLVPAGVAGRRRVRWALVLAAVLLLLIAMAGPQVGFEWQEVERRGVDLIIALDCSRSMLAEDIAPTRLDRAKREIIDLLGMLQGDRVGLVAYSGSAFLQCPLTIDYAAFDLFLNVLSPDYLPRGGTDLNAAVQTAMTAFDPQSAADKAVILITDGEHTGRANPREAAEAARKAGIRLFCIGVGSTGGVPVPTAQGGFQKDAGGQIVLTRLDEELLTHLAVTTGGTYARSVAGDMDLDVIYRDRIRGGMQQATVATGRRQVWADRYQWPLFAAIAFLLIAQAVPAVKTLVFIGVGLCLLVPSGNARAGALQEGYRAYHQGQYEEARRNYIRGQLDDPDNPEVLYNLGNAYYKTGDYEAARSHYQQALPQAPPDLKAKLLYNMGNADYRNGDLQEAVNNYKAALQLTPEDVQARENLEFVEKQLQQQKQRQEGQSQKGDGSQDSPQETSSPSPSSDEQAPAGRERRQGGEQASGDDPEQPQSGPQYGSEMGNHPEENGRQTSGTSGQTPPSAESGGAPAGDSQNESRSAAQMLNRLQDEPGRAMMPDYGKQPVARDW